MNALKITLDNKAEEIIRTLPINERGEFDTHDFINTFLKLDDNAYAALLGQYKDAKGSFKAFHGCIARYLNSLERRGIIEKVWGKAGKKIRRFSLNIKGNMTSNQVWIKL